MTLSEQEAGERETGCEVQEEREERGTRPPALPRPGEHGAPRPWPQGCCCSEALSGAMKAKGLPGLGKYYVGL